MTINANRLVGGRASGYLLVAASLVGWEISVRAGFVDSPNWPAFSEVLRQIVVGFGDSELPAAIASTIWRMLRGLFMGVAAGVPLGFAVGLAPLAKRTLEPAMEFFRVIPVPATIPPLIFVFGVGDSLKLSTIAFATVFPMAISTAAGVRNIEPVHLQVARTFGAPPLTLFLKIVGPGALPFILAGLKASLGLALVVTVVSEMLVGEEGVGHYIVTMQFALRAADMYAAIVVLAGVSYLLNLCFGIWEHRLIGWSRQAERREVAR